MRGLVQLGLQCRGIARVNHVPTRTGVNYQKWRYGKRLLFTDQRPCVGSLHAPLRINRRKLEDQRREAVEKEAANRRATNAQVLEDAERLIAAGTIGAAITARYWFLCVLCPACRTISSMIFAGWIAIPTQWCRA